HITTAVARLLHSSRPDSHPPSGGPWMATQPASITNLETVTDASVPENILPIQYFDRLAVRVTDIPEKRLMFAVLLDAVIHLQRRDSRGAAEAVEWIQGEPDGSVFSFQNI